MPKHPKRTLAERKQRREHRRNIAAALDDVRLLGEPRTAARRLLDAFVWELDDVAQLEVIVVLAEGLSTKHLAALNAAANRMRDDFRTEAQEKLLASLRVDVAEIERDLANRKDERARLALKRVAKRSGLADPAAKEHAA